MTRSISALRVLSRDAISMRSSSGGGRGVVVGELPGAEINLTLLAVPIVQNVLPSRTSVRAAPFCLQNALAQSREGVSHCAAFVMLEQLVDEGTRLLTLVTLRRDHLGHRKIIVRLA